MAEVDMGTMTGASVSAVRTEKAWSITRITLLIVLLLSTGVTQAQSAEQQIKAAFLYHFCSYVQWPERDPSINHTHVTVGVAGTSKAIRLVRETLEGRSNKKCVFHVRTIKPGDDLSDVQMLYIAQKSRFTLEDFLEPPNTPPILTITDGEPLSNNSMINFVIRDDHVRFVISKSRANQAGLKLSSELLAVALQVN